MPLDPSTALGPYEIVSLIGAGGMGEVYRARDTRLGRDVAVKVLPASVSQDAERLRRFEQEARATGMLNHPNILAIYDVGTHEGSFYVVSELLEGQTLRERQAGEPLAQRKAIEYALAIAHGLAAAHAKGIVHRDLKPENIFLTHDNRVKILDFGLAKLTQPASEAAADRTSAPTVAVETTPGVVMGTAGYMSPEQVRGQLADHRTDIFAFGAILYEMLMGRRAFHGDSMIETMNAVLKEEPPEMSAANAKISPALDRIVRRCLEKRADDRFGSARDLAFALDAVAGLSASTTAVAQPLLSAPPPARPTPRSWLWLAVCVVGFLLAVTGAWLSGRRGAATVAPTFRRMTFRHGTVFGGRFAPDGQTIVYSATWEGRRFSVFTTSTAGGRDSRELDVGAARVESISPSGEILVILNPRGNFMGTLARVPLAGGAPRKVLDNVSAADWNPKGSDFLIVRQLGSRQRLEYPVGKVLYETTGAILFPRFSPLGDRIAFAETSQGVDIIRVAVIDLAGRRKVWADWLVLSLGIAWMPGGKDVAVAGVGLREYPAIWAIHESGRRRLLLRVFGTTQLNDIAADGRMLVAHYSWRGNVMCQPPGEKQERDLAWLDWSNAADLSSDGTMVLFDETREGGLELYLRKTDGSIPVRLGQGFALALSPDGAWAVALATDGPPPPRLALLPTGAGEPRKFPDFGFRYLGARYFPDGKRLVLHAVEPGHAPRPYTLDLTDPNAKPKPIAVEGATPLAVSPDGKTLVGIGPAGRTVLYPVEGGAPQPIEGLAPGESAVGWTDKPGWIFTRANEGIARTKIARFELSTGRREPVRELMLADPAGTNGISKILLTPDARAYVYNVNRNLSDLYVVTGPK